MKSILVTGVSRGLGLTLVKILLEEKDLTVYGISRTMTPELRDLIDNYGDRLKWMAYDLANVKDIRNDIFKNFIGFKTQIHGYVNNAAIAYDDIATNLNYGPLLNMYNVNVFSPMLITKFAIRHFLLHNIKGSIVHLSSISVHTGYKGLSMYASSKGALEAFSKNVAREWGEMGIRSNTLVAGFMETDMSATLNDDQKNRIYNRTSMKKPTTVESVAETIKYLLNDGASSITGQNIYVDCGTI